MCEWIFMKQALPCIVYCGNWGKGSFYYSFYFQILCPNMSKNEKKKKLLTDLMTCRSNGRKENPVLNMK